MPQNLILKLFGDFKYGKFQRKARKIAAKINAIEREYQLLRDEDLPKKTLEFKKRIQGGESLSGIMPEAYALVKNAARRMCGKSFEVFGKPLVWNMVHYDVQLIGGIALNESMVAEIATGEGKTLVATLPAYLNALSGLGCHIATVNEYLAMRDSQWMGNLYAMLGLSTSCVYANQSAEEKKKAYLADITYGTSSEFGFDYLRDNSMAQTPEERVRRGFNFCLVDEADSVLIDEARTPLIISGFDEDEIGGIYEELLPSIEKLSRKQRELCNSLASEAANRLKTEKEASKETLSKLWLVKKGMPRNRTFRKLAESGKIGKDFSNFELEMSGDLNKIAAYELKEKLYFTVDEKEQSADLTERGRRELNQKNSYDFVLPNLQKIIREITKSAKTPSERSAAISSAKTNYCKSAERIHAISQLLKAYALYERDVDYIVKDGKIEIIDKNTGRVMEGRRWSEGLHQAVEAKERVRIESENKTYATISIQNYFRMYKKLAGMTGTAESEAQEFADIYKLSVMQIPTNKPCRRVDHPDLIFKTVREKYQAVAEKIRRANLRGQPVLVGTASVEDSELLSRLLKINKIPHNVLNAKNDAKEAEIVAQAGQAGAVTISTNMAGRGTDIKLGDGVEELGGLLVIGTQRYESSRVDRQLQGRCARQGDKGESIFIISLEDELLRLYADMSFLAKQIRLKYREGCPFSHPLFERIIKRAQKKVEGENFSIRKRMLQFDDVSNKQREAIYSIRSEIIDESDHFGRVLDILKDEVSQTVFKVLPPDDNAISQSDLENLTSELSFKYPTFFDEKDFEGLKKKEIANKVFEEIKKLAEEKRKDEGAENSEKLERYLLLSSLDSNWRNHIAYLEDLRNAIYLRSYAQKDPLNEYKIEAFDSFMELLGDIKQDFAKKYFRLSLNENSANSFAARIQREYAKRRAKIA